jgi:uncharacterized membrane protein YfcA
MTLYVLLFITGLAAGTIDAIAGGGGLITLPVLLGTGMPPHLAFGTSKIQASFGTFTAARKYHQHGLIKLKVIYKGIIAGLFGAALGAISAQSLSSELLRILIPIFLLSILFYMLLSPQIGHQDAKPRMNESPFFILFGFALGFYDGFFGPGVGSFWMFCIAFFLGYNLMRATAYTKVFNFNSNIIATICFAIGGNIDYRIGLIMAAGQFIGSKIGAHLAIKNGARLIRPLFLVVVFSTVITQVYAIATPMMVGAVVLLGGFVLLYRNRVKTQTNF